MTYYILPARKGSKRFPEKNRKLLPYTLNSLPKDVYERTILTTDDPWIWERISDKDCKLLKRDPKLASDEASMREVLINVAKEFNFQESDTFVMLYLTYPGRTYEEIKNALNFFRDHDAKSLLCRQPPKSHPFLCMYAEENDRGSQIVDHDLYRYQDYPEVFEISHYIAIQEVGELPNLNRNLYNNNTVFYPIDNVVDVDYKEDFDRFLEKK